MGIVLDADARLKAYSAMVEVDRKWAAVMDAKAALVSALNTGLLALIWTGAKLAEDATPPVLALCSAATLASLLSLAFAVSVVMPRGSLQSALGLSQSTYAAGFRPMTFYGFVATAYKPTEEKRFCEDLMAMTTLDLVREAIEQHFTISRVVQAKSMKVTLSGWLWLLAVVLAVIGFAWKVAC